jgi:hypothetical protein
MQRKSLKGWRSHALFPAFNHLEYNSQPISCAQPPTSLYLHVVLIKQTIFVVPKDQNYSNPVNKA